MGNGNSYYVGVYGSLKSGFSNHDVLQGSPMVDEGWMTGLTLYDLGPFPGVKKGGDGAVFVEVYRVTDEILSDLDVLEGYSKANEAGSLYVRRYLNSDMGPSCWIYLYQGDTSRLPVIEGGNWLGPGITSEFI